MVACYDVLNGPSDSRFMIQEQMTMMICLETICIFWLNMLMHMTINLKYYWFRIKYSETQWIKGKEKF